MKHTNAMTRFLMLALLACCLPPLARSEEATTYLYAAPYGVRIVLGEKGSDFFMGLCRKKAKPLPEEANPDTDKLARIFSARNAAFVIEINERRFGVRQEGLVSGDTGDVLEGTEAAWTVLASPRVSTALTGTSFGEHIFREVVDAIEGHPEVIKAPPATERVASKPGVFYYAWLQPVMLQCGVLLEELIRATLKGKASQPDESMRQIRHWENQLLVDGVRVAWSGNELVNLNTGKQYTDATGMLLKCGEELCDELLGGNPQQMLITHLHRLRAVESFLLRASRK